MNLVRAPCVFVGDWGAALPAKTARDTVIGDETIRHGSREFDLIELKASKGRHYRTTLSSAGFAMAMAHPVRFTVDFEFDGPAITMTA
jgi:hypothetical protein